MESICPTLFNPLAIFVGSQVDEHFVEHLFEKYEKIFLPSIFHNFSTIVSIFLIWMT
jgi:hypothetical protein